jgi:creatine kinase
MNNKDTSVEAVKDEKDNLCADSEEGDAYPNFSRHGKFALLPVYLTPQVYEALRRKRTPSGVTFEDCIQAGVALPHGARPPRGLAGVYAGDADSYRTFSDLFVPLLQDYHQSTDQRHNVRRRQQNQDQQQQPVSGGGAGLLNDPDPTTALTAKQMQGRSRSSTASVGRLQRHQTNLNYSYLVKDTLDPEGEYILYTRMRLARSVAGFRFPPCIRRGERRQVEQLLKDVVMDWPGRYVSVMDMSNSQHDHLIQQQLLFKDPDEYLLTAGFGRDWPDARGIYCDTWHDTPNIIIWCNAEDHLWIISHGKGGNVQGVFTELSKAVGALEAALKARGRGFVEDDKYGFLNASPANIGTALRASVYVKLVRLSRQPGFFDLVAKLRLEARSDYSQTDRRFTGIYDIANAEALGKSEVDLINIMIRGVGFLIELEKKLERGEAVDLDSVELPAS